MSLSSFWPVLDAAPALSHGTVHVWRMMLDLTPADIADLRRVLTDDELARADRFRAERHRHRFIACRAQVRQVLASCLAERPERIEFVYGPQGKPALGPPQCDSGIHFNISNSHDLALCAVALHRDVGVDVERLRDGRDHEGLAERFFASQEVETLRRTPESRRTAAFFNCWTRKEAVLKAVGIGIAFRLDRLVVTMAPDEPARVLAFEGHAGSRGDWRLAHLEPESGYVGAIAAQGDLSLVQRWTHDPQTRI